MKTDQPKPKWLTLNPSLSARDLDAFVQYVAVLAKVPPVGDLSNRIPAVEKVRKEACKESRSTLLKAAVMVLSDFIDQGWSCRLNRGRVQIARPLDTELDRDRIRQQLHVQRDRYLSTPPVREFVAGMERRRLFEGKWVSIFSLMRDGAELAHAIQDSSGDLVSVIKPYVQVVEADERCQFTGLPLSDIWRYFRCTWANRYQSVPGRSLMLLIRDESGHNHPVIGIAALGSSAVQISIRDKWIGWAPEDCVSTRVILATSSGLEC